MPNKFDFEKSINNLEEIERKMDSGELTLEQSLKSYEEAMGIIKSCEKYINEAKLRIETISNGDASEES
jgi:exodeoxyribonuclease VII small subunit